MILMIMSAIYFFLNWIKLFILIKSYYIFFYKSNSKGVTIILFFCIQKILTFIQKASKLPLRIRIYHDEQAVYVWKYTHFDRTAYQKSIWAPNTQCQIKDISMI